MGLIDKAIEEVDARLEQLRKLPPFNGYHPEHPIKNLAVLKRLELARAQLAAARATMAGIPDPYVPPPPAVVKPRKGKGKGKAPPKPKDKP